MDSAVFETLRIVAALPVPASVRRAPDDCDRLTAAADWLLQVAGDLLAPDRQSVQDCLSLALTRLQRASSEPGTSTQADGGTGRKTGLAAWQVRRVTTHWSHARALQRLYPKVRVEEDRIFSVDGNVWTSAGMTAGLDLAMALVEDDFGAEVAKAVARKLVVYLRRPGGQSQFSALLDLEPRSDQVRRALVHAKENLTNELSVEELAEAANLSPRQFSRLFRQETGQTPAKAVEHLRLEVARVMMEEGHHSMDIVARETGFADRERMRRAFLRAYGQPLQVIRRSVENNRMPTPELTAFM